MKGHMPNPSEHSYRTIKQVWKLIAQNWVLSWGFQANVPEVPGRDDRNDP
jgi:hypothetical protein